MEQRPRKFIHIDMDAFYASVEQRDDPALRGRPVVVAWRGARSVVCAASYEARAFGVRSGMPAVRAERLCPAAVFVPPDFARYRAVAQQVRQILLAATPWVEPLALDEAYLDVTDHLAETGNATEVARRIRAQIREVTGLTASAGVAPAKFLAKIASDWRKPDGLFVIRPVEVLDFLAPLPVSRLPGVGKVMDAQLRALGIQTVRDLRARPAQELEQRFGRWGRRLAELALGIDHRRVEAQRPARSISAEDTLEHDLPLSALRPVVERLAPRVHAAAAKTGRLARTVVLKLKTAEFRILTRSLTPPTPPASAAELAALAWSLSERVALPVTTRYRLVGVGLTGFVDAEYGGQADLFVGNELTGARPDSTDSHLDAGRDS
jgi:DNA polymerase-4